MPPNNTNSKRFSRSRRHLLQTALLLPTAAVITLLPGCSPPELVDGSFLQPWRGHMQWTLDDWRRSVTIARRFGSRQLILQWSGILGGDGGDWELSATSLHMLFTAANEADMQVRIGLPFDQRWWQALGREESALQDFFTSNLKHVRQWLTQAPWPNHPAFSGWYIPHELEQYHWTTPTQQQQLTNWLAGIQEAATQKGGDCAASSYFSRLPTQGNLVTLWETLLAQVKLRPMIQDGVGVAGLGNLQHLQPLLQLFVRSNTHFDVIVELFRELPSSAPDGSRFEAESADYHRIRKQLQWARGSGASNVLAFAVDPWVSQDTPQAKTLRRHWNL